MIPQDKNSIHIYSVSEITKDIKVVLENTFAEVCVEGEISNFKVATSGHFYFTLKDKDSILAAAMFVRANRAVKFKIEDGQKVICFGRVEVYEPRGQYQLIIDRVEPKGIGAQQLAFEQLRNKLFKEGLFDPKNKKPFPLMPFRIGVVTSGVGAAVRDILQILKKGAPCVDILVRSVRVQGEGAFKEIAEGIEDLNRFSGVDLIIVCRGGGSIEDLWAFNEELVVKAICNSKIPIISAVGHQINVTLSDLAADFFVETPSAAAKIIVDKKNALLRELDSYKYSMNSSIFELLNSFKQNLVALKHMVKSPIDRLLEKEQLLDELISAMHSHMAYCLKFAGERFNALLQRLDALSPLAVLSRGYSLSMLIDGAIIKDAAKLKPQDRVKTILNKGAFVSLVQEVIYEREAGI